MWIRGRKRGIYGTEEYVRSHGAVGDTLGDSNCRLHGSEFRTKCEASVTSLTFALQLIGTTSPAKSVTLTNTDSANPLGGRRAYGVLRHHLPGL